MGEVKTINSKQLLERQLKDENFRKEYERLEEEFDLRRVGKALGVIPEIHFKKLKKVH